MASKSIFRNVLTAFSVILLILAITYLLTRSILEQSPEIDFRFIWTAGKLWSLGIDPYSSRFTILGRAMFPTGNNIGYWLYPPQWWAIARPLAAVPVETALTIWRGLNVILLLAAASALALAVRRVRPATPPWVLVLAIAAMALMEGTAQTLLLGQTSILICAGFCLIGCALLTGSPAAMATALVLLLLKPQFALPTIACLAFLKQWRPAVLIALAVTGLASLPQIVHVGLLPTATGMLGNMALLGQLRPNRPENLIGASHLIWQSTGADIANAWGILLDFIASIALGLWFWRRAGPDDRDQAALGIGLIASALFFLPLHNYDTVALGPLALLAIVASRVPRSFAWAAVALALRAGVIGAHFGDRGSADRLLLSLAGLLAVIAAVTATLSRFQTSNEQSFPRH